MAKPARPLLVLLGLLTLPAAAFVSPAASATKKMAPLCAQNKDSPERDPITARAAFDALSADATTDSLLHDSAAGRGRRVAALPASD